VEEVVGWLLMQERRRILDWLGRQSYWGRVLASQLAQLLADEDQKEAEE
jgi:hypothetical protein